jgi:hypothetical protein
MHQLAEAHFERLQKIPVYLKEVESLELTTVLVARLKDDFEKILRTGSTVDAFRFLANYHSYWGYFMSGVEMEKGLEVFRMWVNEEKVWEYDMGLMQEGRKPAIKKVRRSMRT